MQWPTANTEPLVKRAPYGRIKLSMSMSKLNTLRNPINKIEAARRQIDFAIRAYLHGEDLLPIHALAFASLTVLKDYSRHSDSDPVWISTFDWFDDHYSRDVANFLKHADRDPHREIPDIVPLFPEFMLFCAAHLYAALTRSPTKEMEVLAFMMRLKDKSDKEAEADRERWDNYFDEEKLVHAEIRRQVEHESRLKFGKEMLQGQLFIPPTLRVVETPIDAPIDLGSDRLDTWD